jgi:hypothetical protein
MQKETIVITENIRYSKFEGTYKTEEKPIELSYIQIHDKNEEVVLISNDTERLRS